MKPKRAALYLRVSTGEQTTNNQRLALGAACEQRGWQVVTTYADPGISGAKGRDERPEFDRMLKDAARGQFNVVMAARVTRRPVQPPRTVFLRGLCVPRRLAISEHRNRPSR